MNVIAIELGLPPQQYEQLAAVARARQQSVAEIAQTAVAEWLALLQRQTAEQAFIDSAIMHNEAVDILGLERVEEIEYARQALTQDIRRGLGL